MNIIKATYGSKDCTAELKKKIREGRIIMRVDNTLIGDPKVGAVKFLEVRGEHDGVVFFKKVREGAVLVCPEATLSRLGIFYSNNNNKMIWDSIYLSLETIRAASKGKADIITCMWESMPENPFCELISWYRSQSHLNQLLQILQCLYAAKDMAPYKYVSFLEHDVMYPEGYFDYPDFAPGTILTNMNYGGLTRNGWQVRKQDDEPCHQMTMRFDDALKHCLDILPNAIKTNSGLIENQFLTRKQWRCKNEAIHINHGVHFTSHNSIYSKTELSSVHPYWGACNDYLRSLTCSFPS